MILQATYSARRISEEGCDPTQKVELVDQWTRLGRNLAVRTLQSTYTLHPFTTSAVPHQLNSFVEDTPLYLPSASALRTFRDITMTCHHGNGTSVRTVRTSLEHFEQAPHQGPRLLTYKERQVQYQGAKARAHS